MKTQRFLTLLIGFWLFLMALPSVAADNNKQLGQTLCKACRYAEAVPYLEKSVAANRRSGALWYLAIARQHLYDFEGAIECIETYRSVLHSEEWLDRADSLLEVCRIGQRAFEHTLDVVVIDSMLVPKDRFFEYYHLGEESGRIISSEEGLMFENPGGDHRIFGNGSGFVEQHRFQDQWDEPHPLQGVGSEDFRIIDPFLMADGVTLYFASDSLPSIGGLDIYRTSYDDEAGSYYQPERLGMPFNSPFDDYMMAFDETNQVGWWATERHAVPDSVMIYLFLMNAEETSVDEPTVSRARIDCIAETWKEKDGYASLLEAMRNAPATVDETPQLHIIVGDGIVYTREEQFRSSEALQNYKKSVKLEHQIAEIEASLDASRKSYRKASATMKKSLSANILQYETLLLNLNRERDAAVLRYRSLENGIKAN